MDTTIPTRDSLREEASKLFLARVEIHHATSGLHTQPHQGLRALMTRAYSLSNACEGLLMEAWQLIVKGTDLQLTAVPFILDLAKSAFATASDHCGFYQAQAARVAAGQKLADPVVDDDSFRQKLQFLQSDLEGMKTVEKALGTRLTELQTKSAEKAVVASALAAVAAHLVKGVGEDIITAQGQPPQALSPDAVAFPRERFLANGQLLQSTGVRSGFLQAAYHERALAYRCLDQLMNELVKQLAA